MLRVEPEIKANYVASGAVSLAFWHVLDHGDSSVLAHRTAECAGQQDPLSFWRMHDLLFERQEQLWYVTAERMVEWATELELDIPAFQRCLTDPDVQNKVVRMDQERRTRGIRIRPSFDLNGQLIEGAVPLTTFIQLLDK